MSEVQGTSAPDTLPEKALPLPKPTSPPSPPIPSVHILRSWFPLYIHKTDRTITHLNTILSTPSGIDTLLMTLGYTSLLTSTVLTSISLARLRNTARQLIENAISLPPDTTLVISTSARTTKSLLFSTRLKKLSGLISDFRIFVRLWGLLQIWSWGKSVYTKEKREDEDVLVRRIAYAQVAVNVFYQYLENGAYLSSKGVLGWSTEKQNWAWVWSSRFWVAHVGLDLVRLGKEFASRKRKEDGVVEEGEKEWRAKWRREMVVNLAYAPLTLHWSLEKGLVGDFWVGLLGSVAGVTKFRELWKNTGAL